MNHVHVRLRRDFVTASKSWPEHKEWTLRWRRRIRGQESVVL